MVRIGNNCAIHFNAYRDSYNITHSLAVLFIF